MSKALSFYTAYSKSAFALLAGVCALSVFLYGVFLLEAVGHTASRARAAQEIKHLKSELSGLENRYLSAAQDLTPERAAALGFVSPKEITTVYAKGNTAILTLKQGPLVR